MLRGKAVLLAMLFGLLGGMNSMIASADMFGGNDCPPWEYDCNDWPEWTPMYWMEEMSDEWDDDDDDYYRYGGMGPYGMPGMMPYGGGGYGMPYGGGMPPMPYGAPYGGGYGAPAPYGAPYGGGYGAPAPYGQVPAAPQQQQHSHPHPAPAQPQR